MLYECVNATGCTNRQEPGCGLGGCKDRKPSQDDKQELTDRDISIHLAYDYLSLIDEAECSLEAWNRICNAKELLDDH